MFNFNFRNKKVKIVEKFGIFAIISLIIIIAGIVDMIVMKGMNIGVEFSAGATIEVSVKGIDGFDSDTFKNDFEGWLKGDRNFDGAVDDNATVYSISPTQTSTNSSQETFEFRIGPVVNKAGVDINLLQTDSSSSSDEEDEDTTLLITEAKQLKTEVSKAAIAYLNNKYKPSTEITQYTDNVTVTTHTVDNSVMLYTVRTSIIAILVAIGVILIYIAIRFKWMSGIAAIIALSHDVLIMICLTAIFRIPVNSTFIAAVITIIGYSINSTIVIFDRVREVERIPSMQNESDAFIANYSIMNTMSRSILTNITTLVMIALLAAFGSTSIKEFAYPIIFGLLAGFYSSVLLSAPLWVKLRKLFKLEGKRPVLKVKTADKLAD